NFADVVVDVGGKVNVLLARAGRLGVLGFGLLRLLVRLLRRLGRRGLAQHAAGKQQSRDQGERPPRAPSALVCVGHGRSPFWRMAWWLMDVRRQEAFRWGRFIIGPVRKACQTDSASGCWRV